MQKNGSFSYLLSLEILQIKYNRNLSINASSNSDNNVYEKRENMNTISPLAQ